MKQILLLVLFSLLVPSIICAQEILFFDDFEDGMDDAWEMPDGGWEVVDGHLHYIGYESPLYAGGEQQSDYILSFDLMILSGTNVSLHCRVFYSNSPIESGYSVNFGYMYAPILTIYKHEERDPPILQHYMDISIGQVRHIRIGRIGSELVVKYWADGEMEPDWQASVVDDSYHSGYWQLQPSIESGWIDNVLVEGYGTVSTDQSSWGSLKALYR